MSYAENNKKANQNNAQKMGNAILNEIDQFKYAHQTNGYTHLDVTEFLDKLEILVQLNMNTNTDTAEDGKAKQFDHEYIQCSNKMIEDIKRSRFTQGFRGYDTAEVDRYLDDLIRLIEYNRDYKLVKNMIDQDALTYASFSTGLRGYDSAEVDEFIKKISFQIEKLNNIKRKFI